MLQQIIGSPDLTEKHKEGLITFFGSQFLERAERFHTKKKAPGYRAAEPFNPASQATALTLGLNRLAASLKTDRYNRRILDKVARAQALASSDIDRGLEADSTKDPQWLSNVVAQVNQQKQFDGKDVERLGDIFARQLTYS